MSYYNEEYFDYQKSIGAFGGKANKFKFEKFIKKESCLVDFGSGGGYLLSNFECKEKIGVEINQIARDRANELGVSTVFSPKDIEDSWADVIISNHALEHVSCPLSELQELYKKLKKGGKIIFVTPYEKKNRYKAKDVNFHLYTWSEMNLGNLFTLAGFEIIEVKELKHRWPPHFFKIRKLFGEKLFNLICRLYGTVFNSISQIKIVATKSNK